MRLLLVLLLGVVTLSEQPLPEALTVALSQTTTSPPQTPKGPTRADILRGEYGWYRANNDLLYYHLDVRVVSIEQGHEA